MGPQKPGQGSAAKPPIPNLPLADGRVQVPGGTPDQGGRARQGSLPRTCRSCGKGVAAFPDPEGVKWVRVPSRKGPGGQCQVALSLVPAWRTSWKGGAPGGGRYGLGRAQRPCQATWGWGLCAPSPRAIYIPGLPVPSRSGCEQMAVQMEVSSDAEHFHVYAQEHKVLQFPHRQRPLGIITRVRVLSDHHLAQVELAKRGLSWGDRGY
ncbi:grifin isoform X4 [Cebus imitator]|uniref:grifin isoform X4 n=1 Tax=Cebus imitator TaxID=2715852 RepID=UPI00189760BD|nr:grifin isoform X4 [Cebus imitator]